MAFAGQLGAAAPRHSMRACAYNNSVVMDAHALPLVQRQRSHTIKQLTLLYTPAAA